MSKHKQIECGVPCPRPGTCMFCDGGLAACSRCGGLEGGLPTECPGAFMSEEIQNAVYAGGLDFQGGAWVAGDGEMPCRNHKLQFEGDESDGETEAQS